MRFLTLLLLFPLAVVHAQEPSQGIHFEHGLSWSAIQAKAKAENKYIFVDCFTTWCGPCRYMTTKIFPQKASGDYFNDRFVSVAIQLDTTSKDTGDIKAWYADAHAIAKEYHVNAYPTYLVFAPDGHIVHRLVGSRIDAKRFIADVAEAFDSTKQYYTLIGEYDRGRRDSAFLHRLALQCVNAYEMERGKPVIEAYLSTQHDLLTRDNIILLVRSITKSTDKYFSVLTDHAAEIDKVMNGPVAAKVVRDIYLKEGAGQSVGDNRPPNWKALHARIAAHLPAEADELTARIKVNYYRDKKDWPKFETAMVAYMKGYGAKMSDMDLNNIAWAVFQNCPDMTCVADILDWSKHLSETNNPAYLDTYANILYKLGKKEDAIALEEKALSIDASDKANYQATIDKMKKSEKTWN
ncbi:MAG TPA: TlpA disulfide reductase family protein [Puia sp.]|nr:TlpA disulfide reductase family protein [Puia sp.]